jgi:hypothetical protein
MQEAFLFHIWVLWGLVDPKTVPYDPPADVLSTFSLRFKNDDQLQQQRSMEPLIRPQTVAINVWDDASVRGRNMMTFEEFDEGLLGHMKSTMARFGLTRFCPDLRESPRSLYNKAHRIVAVESFKQGLIGCMYATFNANSHWASRTEDLVKIYDHHVHYFLRERYRLEKRKAGGNIVRDAKNAKMQGRGQVSSISFVLIAY